MRFPAITQPALRACDAELGLALMSWCRFHLKAFGALRVAASAVNRVLRVGKKWPSHNDLALFVLGGDEFIRRFVMLDPIGDDREPIDLSCAGSSATVKATWNQKKPAVFACFGIVDLD